MQRVSVTLLILCLLVVGCSSAHRIDTVSLDHEIHYKLQAVPESLPKMSALQLVTVTRGDEQNTLLLQSERSEQQLNLVALTAQGISLFSLSLFKDGNYHVENHLPGINLYPSNMLADMQLATWPLINVKQGLLGASITQQQDARIISDLNGEVMRIRYTDTTTTITHMRRHYTITIEEIN